jgi:PAS domain S-box-containing protein
MNSLEPYFFQEAVDQAFNHIIITDSNGVITYANAAVERITGYAHDEIIGSTPALWGKQMEPSVYATMWQTLKKDKKPYTGELINKRKNGQQYHAKVVISPIVNPKTPDVILGYIGTEEDISFQKEYEKERNEFFSRTAHNLRTPLGAMSWNLELALSKNMAPGKKIRTLLHKVYDTNTTLISFINNLLFLFEIQNKTYTPRSEIFGVKPALSEIYKSLSALTRLKKITIDDASVAEHAVIKTDPHCFQTVVFHIIRNAIHYSHPHETVHISLQKTKTNTILIVKDTGIGMNKEEQAQIFTQFFHSSRSIYNNYGVGLGLFMVKTWMIYIGGEVWFETKLNKGTTFYCAFPN